MSTTAPSRMNSILASMPPDHVIFGTSKIMEGLREKVEIMGKANVPVLIQGESGTGKDILCRLLHEKSLVANGPFVKVNCPAIPGTLLESELFGYERGAFTGAYGSKPGRIEMANRGTLFLDEIGEMDLSLQAKLLQLLQDGQFCRIGAQEDTKVQVRFICATNRDLVDQIALGTFREDLYYRINVLSLRMPALRERPDDVPVLVNYFLAQFSRAFQRPAKPLSTTLVKVLQGYHWPGNIRELENLMKRYVVFGTEEAITTELRDPDDFIGALDLPIDGQSVALKKLTKRAVAKLERQIILRVLQAHQWNRKKAAVALQISYRALLYKLKEAGIPPSRPALKSANKAAEVQKDPAAEAAPHDHQNQVEVDL